MADEELDGLLSQDDIDAAMAAAGMSGGSGDAGSGDASAQSSDPEPAADAGDFDQAEIDALMNGGGEVPAPAAPAADAGDFDQAEIDALLSGAEEVPTAGSQEEIDQAVAAATAENSAPVVDDRVDATGRPFDEVAAAMAAAIESEQAAAAPAPAAQTPVAQAPLAPPPPLPPGASPVQIPQIEGGRPPMGPEIQGLDLLRDVDLNVKIELGRCRMLVDDVLRLGDGAVVELDKLAGDPVDIYVNNRLVARGEVLVLNDNFCVRVSDIVSRELEETSLTA